MDGSDDSWIGALRGLPPSFDVDVDDFAEMDDVDFKYDYHNWDLRKFKPNAGQYVFAKAGIAARRAATWNRVPVQGSR
jgi:hypothetical protein